MAFGARRPLSGRRSVSGCRPLSGRRPGSVRRGGMDGGVGGMVFARVGWTAEWEEWFYKLE